MPPRKQILLIEDDPFARQWFVQIVKKRFRDGLAVVEVSSERELLLRLGALSKLRFSAIVVDLILPWEDGVALEEDAEPTKPRGDVYEAGIRILQDLHDLPTLRDVPVALYTVNDPDRIAWPELDGFRRPKFINKQAPDERLLTWLADVLH
jgi:CheY-like chemotaxis protein